MDLELSILTKYTDFRLLGPEMKVHGSTEVPGHTEINMKAKSDIKSTSKVDQNHLKYILGTLAIHFTKYHDIYPYTPIFGHFGPNSPKFWPNTDTNQSL